MPPSIYHSGRVGSRHPLFGWVKCRFDGPFLNCTFSPSRCRSSRELPTCGHWNRDEQTLLTHTAGMFSPPIAGFRQGGRRRRCSPESRSDSCVPMKITAGGSCGSNAGSLLQVHETIDRTQRAWGSYNLSTDREPRDREFPETRWPHPLSARRDTI